MQLQPAQKPKALPLLQIDQIAQAIYQVTGKQFGANDLLDQIRRDYPVPDRSPK